jgi:serine phosphatase RsbU (regulator of sigma subunit)
MKRLLLFLFLLSMASAQAAPSSAVLDLSTWSPGEKSILPLDSKWEMYWNKRLSPGDINYQTAPDLLTLPTAWNDLQLNGKTLGSYGCATYRLVLVNVPQQELMLEVYSMQTSCTVFINGKIAVEAGKPGCTKESTQPMTRDMQVGIPAGSDTLEIVVQVANFHHRKGGFVHPFEIGTAEAITKQRTMYYILSFAESSALAIIGLFLFALYIFRRKDLSILYFALFCITLSFRPVTAVHYHIAALFPGISWQLLLKIEYLAVLLPCLFMTLFVRKLFPKQLSALLVKILGVIILIKISITLFFAPSVFSWLVLPLLFLITTGVIIFTITILKAMMARVEGARYAGMGLVILLASLLLKVMVYAGIIAPVHVLITVLDIAFIFMMSMILGARFSIEFVKVETLQKRTEVLHHVIEMEKEQVEMQKELVEIKNKEITDSITYARRIQHAILPPPQMVKKYFPSSFILYKPKDIVAGDFYWMEHVRKDNENGIVLFAAADCTGHGVPGAMVSVVCNNALNRSVREFGLLRPDTILEKTRELVIEQFERSEDDVKDGMDIALCAFDPATLRLQYSGANNNVYIIRKEGLIELKADKQPVGKHTENKPFTFNEFQLEQGDCIYVLSDGYADQFGGADGKKFKTAKLKELLIRISAQSMEEQEKELENTFVSWKGKLEQVDDVLVIGIRV